MTRRGINTLMVQKISRASADQRAGRAGRLGPGTCLRLWPEREHLHRAESELPEMRRLDLSETFLTLAVVKEVAGMDFDWFEDPTDEARKLALEMLQHLGALERDSLHPTPLGRKMSAFPLHPRFSRMLLTAADFGCLPDGASVRPQGRARTTSSPVPTSRWKRRRSLRSGMT